MNFLNRIRGLEERLPSSVTKELVKDATGRMLEAELLFIDDTLAHAEEIQLSGGDSSANKLIRQAHEDAYLFEDSLEVIESILRNSKAGSHGSMTRTRNWTQALQQGLASGVSALNRKELLYGRGEEEKGILEHLLRTEENGEKVKVINIRGEGGVGKTALAGHVYFNASVIRSFQHRVWVNLPHRASLGDIAVKILESVTGISSILSQSDYDLQLLLSNLERHLAGTKFLLVLDNCCIKDNSEEDWGKIIDSLGFMGSAMIILTGSHEGEGFVPPADHIVPLLPLPLLDCHSILLHHAGVVVVDDDELIEAEGDGFKIVNRLGNLPLAAKMVGSFLRDKDPDFWSQTLRDEKLNTRRHENSNVPSFIILCYLDLPVPVRRCFKFLSVFPKGYRFQRKQMVLLWMALGFLRQSRQSGKSMEEVGNQYFDYLILRSFFQRLDDGVSFVIHDMVHDLALYILQESCEDRFFYHGSIEGLQEVFAPLSLRGVWLREEPCKLLPSQDVGKELSKLNPSIFRMLSLSRCNITELPHSIGVLKHLHYLDLSCTALQVLPDSIGELLFLQTLLLTNCTSLTSLPERLVNLANLRHLDIRGTRVQEMPGEISRLTSLKTLTDFVVSESPRGFQDLKGLSNVTTLAISNLHKVVNATDASCAELRKKTSLEDLTLRWGSGPQDHREIGYEVLAELVPQENIKHLTIDKYWGEQFPGWLGNEIFQSLQSVKLHHCDCTSLPPLGQLQGLKDLVIESFHKITHVGPEFCEQTVGSKAFSSLESLQFWDMSEWIEWKIPEDVEFQKLRELSVICCPKLVRELPKKLLELEKLDISGCKVLEASLPNNMKPTCQVHVHDSNEALMKKALEVHNSSRHLTVPAGGKQMIPYSISSIIQKPAVTPLEAQSPAVEGHVPEKVTVVEPVPDSGTTVVTVEPVPVVESPVTNIPGRKDPSPVETSSSDDEQSCFEMLKVSNDSHLEERLPSKLDSLRIEDYAHLKALPESFLTRIEMIKELYLINCNSLTSFPPLEFLVCLTTLYVTNCPKLEFFPTSDTIKKFESLEHLCIGNSCNSLKDFILDIFPKLRTLCLCGCSNLVSITISERFEGNLACLESLEIMDCPNLESFPTGGLPSPNMASLLVSNCKILKNIPNCQKTLLSLQSLTIRDCPALESDSMEGLPSSLISLSIASCGKFMLKKSWGMQNLQNLSSFEIEGGFGDMESFPEETLLPSNINTLRISRLESLNKLDYKGFKRLNNLQAFEIDGCQLLQSLPEEGFPSSLQYLSINQSPLLTEKLRSKAGKEWSKVAHIPQIEIDGEVICALLYTTSNVQTYVPRP